MSNNKQSSVEWFANESWQLKVQLDNQEISVDEYAVAYVRLLYKAKEMEKENTTKFTIAFMAWLYNNEYYYKRKQKMYLKSYINESKFFTIDELMIEFNKIQ
jgi:phage antirepressor YoqD-like protein